MIKERRGLPRVWFVSRLMAVLIANERAKKQLPDGDLEAVVTFDE